MLTMEQYRPVFELVYLQLVRRVRAGEDLQAEVFKSLPTREEVQHSDEFYQEVGKKGRWFIGVIYKIIAPSYKPMFKILNYIKEYWDVDVYLSADTCLPMWLWKQKLFIEVRKGVLVKTSLVFSLLSWVNSYNQCGDYYRRDVYCLQSTYYSNNGAYPIRPSISASLIYHLRCVAGLKKW
ncbi:hypothetical protein SAMN05880558_1057 [Aeromonas sp. RU39B]|nr:hypothetical protein SAMN05880558_1057 [Aeromonas sp. RU39B]